MVRSAVIFQGAVRISIVLIRPRLLGYAGAPIILFTPCFVLSVVTAARILRMYAEIRERRAGEGDRSQSTRVINIGPRMNTSKQSATMPVSSVSDKHPPPTLGGQTGVTVDLRLQCTRSSSRVSVPLTPGTIATNSHTPHFPIELPTLPPMTFPSSYLSQSSPLSSTKDLSFSDVDRGQTPSPIVFALAPVPSSQPHAQLDAAGEPCDNGCASWGLDPVLPPPPTVSEEPLASPASPSRAPISLEVGERMPRFHLPTRSPPNGLRPSLELSPEYSLARLEADRVTLTRCLENLPSSPCSSHRRLISSLASGEGLGFLPNSTYTDRALEGLPEVDSADKGSIVKSEDDLVDECEVVSPEFSEPPLKPVRQFYREQPFVPSLTVK